MTSLVYSTGTVSVSNASAVVTGTGTAWALALVTGGMFSFAGMSVPILSVESDTSLTLAYPWPGATASGGYAIARETSEAVRAAWINDRLARLMTKPWGTGVVPDGRGTLSERDALNPMPTDKYCWLREETGFDPTLYFKTPSGWIGPYPLVGEKGLPGVGAGGYGLPAGGATGQVPTKTSAVDGAVAWATPVVTPQLVPPGLLFGAVLSNNVTDATNDIDVSAGVVASGDATPVLMTHSAGTMQLDVAYGSGNGGRFDSAISDGTWHCFIISNGTTVSRGMSKSLNPTGQANYPSGYTRYRRVGSIMRVSGVILGFIQDADTFMLKQMVMSFNITNPGTSALTQTLNVPTGIRVNALCQLAMQSGTINTDFLIYVSDLSVNDTVPSAAGLSARIRTVSATGTYALSVPVTVFTNTSGQVRFRINTSDSATGVFMSTAGWVDARGRLA